MKKILNIILFSTIIISCSDNEYQEKQVETNEPIPVQNIVCNVIAEHPHDTSLFTEGFLVHKGQVYESTGSPDELTYTESMIGISDLTTGKFERKIKLDKSIYFGEGICVLKGKLYQLTYQNKEGFIYQLPSFELIGKFTYENKEGWGLTSDGQNLIMSDGSDMITFMNPETLKPLHKLKITANGNAQNYLNELEFIKGYLYANIWMTNLIVKINPKTGCIVGQIDLSSLVLKERMKKPTVDVMNGIAYDEELDKIYITGKLWSSIYEIAIKQ